MDTITFDIETIPDPELSQVQQEELERRAFSKSLSDRHEMSMEECKKLIGGTSPFFGKIVCIGMHKTKGPASGTQALVGDEKDILLKFWETISSAKFHGIFISYNGLSFDAPFILRRSAFYGILPTNKNFLNLRRFSYNPHFDVKELLANWDRFGAVTLHLACDLHGIPTPKAGISGKDVADEFHKGHIQDIADYCVRDVEATYALYKKLQPYV